MTPTPQHKLKSEYCNVRNCKEFDKTGYCKHAPKPSENCPECQYEKGHGLTCSSYTEPTNPFENPKEPAWEMDDLVMYIAENERKQTAKECLQIIKDSINRPEAVQKITQKYLQ